jgi:hypothetical protein
MVNLVFSSTDHLQTSDFLCAPKIVFGQAIFIHCRKSICLTGTYLRYNVTLLVNKVERFQDRTTGLG